MISRIFRWFKRDAGKTEVHEEIITNKYPKTRFSTSVFKDAKIKIRYSSIEITAPNMNAESILFSDIDYIVAEKYTFDAEDIITDGLYFWISIKNFSAGSVDASSWMDGFGQLEKWLLKLPGLDRKAYLDFIEKDITSVILWRKAIPENLVIHEIGESSADLLQQGIWLDNRSVLIKWGTYNELIDSSLFLESPAFFHNELFTAKKYRINNPIIFNGLRLVYLECTTDSYYKDKGYNADLPVLKFNSQIQIGNHAEKTFMKLKSHLDDYFKDWEVVSETGSHLSCTFTKDRVLISISCLYRDDLKDYDGICWLDISYKPELTRFYTDDYQQNLKLTDAVKYLLLPISAEIDSTYRFALDRECYSRYTPGCFQSLFSSNTQFLIWIDVKAEKTGFATSTQALIFNNSDIEEGNLVFFSSYFRDSLPDIHLRLDLPGKNETQIIAQLGSFTEEKAADLASELEGFLKIKLIKTEDRQYY